MVKNAHTPRQHEGRDDLAGEHRLGDSIQLILMIIFAVIWISDSFIFHYSDNINQFIPLTIRLITGVIILLISGSMARSTLNIVFGQVRKVPAVIRDGLFSYCRHPMYLSAIFLYCGVLCLHISLAGLIFLIPIAGFYHFIARHEEKLLMAKFGEEYKKYQQEVRMWIPIKKAS